MPPLAGFDALKTRRARSLARPRADETRLPARGRARARARCRTTATPRLHHRLAPTRPARDAGTRRATVSERVGGRQEAGLSAGRARERRSHARTLAARTPGAHAPGLLPYLAHRFIAHRRHSPPAAYRPRDAPLLLLAIAESAVLGSWILPVRKRGCSKQCVFWCSELTKSFDLNF